MATTKGSFGEYLEPGLRKIFNAADKAIPRMAEQVLYSSTSTKATEHFLTEGGFEAASEVDEGDSIGYIDPTQGYKKSLSNVKYGIGFQVTEEMWDDDQYGRVKKFPKRLARSMRYNVETVAANIFNNGFGTATTADGQYLFDTDHTLLGSGTYANEPSTSIDLCVSGLEAALINLQLTVDDQSMITPYQGKILLIHPNNQFTAKRILGSTQDWDTANNAINPLKGELQIMVWPYLTDTDAWFVLDSKDNREMGPMLLWRKRADFKRDDDIDKRIAKYNTAQRYLTGAPEWRGTYGSPGG